MKNTKLDPLEENKVEGKSNKGGKKRTSSAAKKRPITEPHRPPAEPSDLPESASGKYEVLEDKKVSIRGHITSMPKGTVIQLAHYGRKVMANMVKQGLKLKGLD